MSLGGSEQHPFLECPRQDQDIVFLIDGSGSISHYNFKIMLQFVQTVMSQFHRPHTQVCLWGHGGPGLGPAGLAEKARWAGLRSLGEAVFNLQSHACSYVCAFYSLSSP